MEVAVNIRQMFRTRHAMQQKITINNATQQRSYELQNNPIVVFDEQKTTTSLDFAEQIASLKDEQVHLIGGCIW